MFFLTANIVVIQIKLFAEKPLVILSTTVFLGIQQKNILWSRWLRSGIVLNQEKRNFLSIWKLILNLISLLEWLWESNSQPVQSQISASSDAYENTEPVETNFLDSFNEIRDQENFLKEKVLASLKLFLENIKINGEFLTQDILNDKLFLAVGKSMLIKGAPNYPGKLIIQGMLYQNTFTRWLV